MLSEARIFFGGVGTSLVSVAIVVAFGQAASHEPRPRQSIPELYSQLQPIAPASAEAVAPRAPVEQGTEARGRTGARGAGCHSNFDRDCDRHRARAEDGSAG